MVIYTVEVAINDYLDIYCPPLRGTIFLRSAWSATSLFMVNYGRLHHLQPPHERLQALGMQPPNESEWAPQVLREVPAVQHPSLWASSSAQAMNTTTSVSNLLLSYSNSSTSDPSSAFFLLPGVGMAPGCNHSLNGWFWGYRNWGVKGKRRLDKGRTVFTTTSDQ